MTSAKAIFQFFPRGFERTLILLPGWATDERIFERLKVPYNYLFVRYGCLKDFPAVLAAELKRLNEPKVSILGWSMGGFLACDFLSAYPRSAEEIFFLGVRQYYPQEALDAMGRDIASNKEACLFKFYQNCFSTSENEARGWFRRVLLEPYSKEMPREALQQGLDYLGKAQIRRPASGTPFRVSFFHGTDDKVAPLGSRGIDEKDWPQARFEVLAGAGHALFLNPFFNLGALKNLNAF